MSILALLIVPYLSAARLRLQTAFNFAGALQAELMSEAAIEQVALSLVAEGGVRKPSLRRDASDDADAGNRPLHDGAPRYCAIEQAVAAISIEEEAGKIDLNVASEKLLRTVLLGLGLDQRDAQGVAAGVVAFRTAKLEKTLPAETDANVDDKPFGLKRAPFQTIAEFDQAPLVTPEIKALMQPLITVHSRSPGVDERTAPPALFASLTGAGPEEVRALLETPFPNALNRKDPHFPAGSRRAGDGGAFLAHVEILLPTGQVSAREAVIELNALSKTPFSIREIRSGRSRYLRRLREEIKGDAAASPLCLEASAP